LEVVRDKIGASLKVFIFFSMKFISTIS